MTQSAFGVVHKSYEKQYAKFQQVKNLGDGRKFDWLSERMAAGTPGREWGDQVGRRVRGAKKHKKNANWLTTKPLNRRTLP